MDWKRLPSTDPADPDGLTALLQRAQQEIGGAALSGTRFIHDSREMLGRSREIEAAVLGAPTTLYVGFQTAHRLDQEADIYTDLVASGTGVTAFGTGWPASDTGVRWIALPEHPDRLENQWFLVTFAPEPIAFVGFEIADPVGRPNGDDARGRRTWEGFVSHDPRLVDALVGHLDGVVDQHTPSDSRRR